jgi:hypothetical protein
MKGMLPTVRFTSQIPGLEKVEVVMNRIGSKNVKTIS